ncbi:MAG: hypothetical protein GF421_09015 [Candidatus Aminicenantes bacterium]|nr:hypothetical protein [Candidatus Aminicenantes bacterium]
MKFRSLFQIFVISMGLVSVFSFSLQPESTQGIVQYLPDTGALSGWNQMGAPQTAKGEDLFLLINGGAEIYHEYGFEKAVIQSYKHQSGLSLNVELYEMTDSISAYGMFSFKTGSQGQILDIGLDSLLEDYYLNFWKNNFVVTVIGFDASESTQRALIQFAQIMEAKLPGGGKRPPLMDLFSARDKKMVRRVFMEGNLSFYNQYEFDSENIFGIQKGAAVFYRDHTVFLLEYSSRDKALLWFQNAFKHLNQNQRFQSLKMSSEGGSFLDQGKNYIFILPFQKFILIYLGKNDSNARKKLENLKKKISEY